MTKAINVHPDGNFTPHALVKVTAWATEGKTKRWIAASLDVPFKRFEALMDKAKGDNPLRIAWETGYAAHEQEIVDRLIAVGKGESKGAMIALIFYSKAKLGWTDKADAPGTGADNRVQIFLPAPMARGEYYKMMGVQDPADTAKDIGSAVTIDLQPNKT